MTVVVETAEGIKAGSAVRHVSIYKEHSFLPDQGGTFYNAGGEAVVVDLGQRGLLFALMFGYPYGDDYAGKVVNDFFPLRERTKLGTKVTIPPSHYPLFVHFKDPNDSKTVEKVIDVEQFEVPSNRSQLHYRIKKDRFEEVFGKGVRLKEVTLEATDDPVTEGIEQKLPWLHNMYSYISGKHVATGPELYEWLMSTYFTTRKPEQ